MIKMIFFHAGGNESRARRNLAPRPVNSGIDERQGDVAENGRSRQQVERLENKTDLFFSNISEFIVGQLRYIMAVEPISSARRRIKRSDNMHEGRLAGTRWSHNSYKSSISHLKRNLF